MPQVTPFTIGKKTQDQGAKLRKVFASMSLKLVLSGLILVIALLLWLGLGLYHKSLNQKILLLQKELLETQASRQLELEREILAFAQQAKLSRRLYQDHIYFSKAFRFLEENTLPGIYFQSFQGKAQGAKIHLEGNAASYEVLAAQVKTFEDQPQIKALDLGPMSLAIEGGVSFSLELSFKEDFFKS